MPPIDLEVGDVLFYSPSDLIGVLIAIKTWTWLSHVEVYHGSDRVVAARRSGVDLYPVRLSNLVAIRRPLGSSKFSREGAWKAVFPLIGKDYEESSFESFLNPWCIHRKVSRICSSIVTSYLRGGGVGCFNPDVPENKIAPAQLWQTNDLYTVWSLKKR